MDVTLEQAPALPPWLAAELPFRRRRVRIDGRRVHFVDEGHGRDAIVLFHGNPTWCYLWRKVIARLLPSSWRVVAPDLLGLGLSDKPRRPRTHTLPMHVGTMSRLVEALELDSMILVGQDWGGPIAAGVGAAHPERVRGLVFANTAVLPPRRPIRSTPFHRLSHVPLLSDALFRGLGFPLGVMSRAQGDRGSIGRAQRRAYRWPLRRMRDRAAPLGLARMVPDRETHPSTGELDRIGGWVERYPGPMALVWGVRDPVLGRALRRHRRELSHARVYDTPAGHFLQEEVPEALVEAIGGVAAEAHPAGVSQADRIRHD